MSETIQIGGIEFNIDDLETAIEECKNDNGDIIHDPTIVNTVIVAGNEDYEESAYFANIEDVIAIQDNSFDAEETAKRSVNYVEERIEDVRKTAPVEHVEELTDRANDVIEQGNDGYFRMDKADVEVKYKGTMFGEEEMMALQDDDATSIGKIKHTDDGILHMAVFVDEDEL